MDPRRLEWESEESKKERAVREANREMDARAGDLTRTWEDDPSIHHSNPEDSVPPPLPVQVMRPAKELSQRDLRRIRSQQRPRPRNVQPHLKESVRSATRYSKFREQIRMMRRIRMYLLLAAAILLIAGVMLFVLLQSEKEKESALPDSQQSTVSAANTTIPLP